ncbi:hypothetical protein AcV5_006838 [Taiwanofungus camphoratus]|nr:hypothetical protein AcV5_006838 [Antrodia cinnamomea]KAI0935210.1 hypothetical protein AcV7_003707 [Antrodia cinnamomea]
MMQPAEAVPDAMVTDGPTDGAQSSQQNTQSTQQASQPDYHAVDAHLWGYLQPCSSRLVRVDFLKIKSMYTVGRNGDPQNGNDIVFPGMKISNFHCKIVWDGREDKRSAIMVMDLSSNGTFINGEKIGKGRHALLREGNEIAFGTAQPQPGNGGLEDYRFVYRHMAAGIPTQGLYAHYQLHEELGKGSFATVMKAMNRDDGQWYAIKVIQTSKINRTDTQSTTMNKFAREISILEGLQHPNICQLKEVFFEEWTINLVLEFVRGGDLLDYIIKNNGLREPEAQHLTYQICDALAYIHDKGIAHRDLKPENVLLTDDMPPRIKVADFGLAKVIDSQTRLRTMCGTPIYLAPEVLLQQNNEGYSPVVDSWSVGVIVFSMLTSSSPFIENTEEDMQTRIINRQVDWDSLRSNGRIVSSLAEHFMRRLLDVRPEHRMTLSAARRHPWLEEQAAENNLNGNPAPRVRTASPEPEVDTAMVSLRSDGMSLDAHDDAQMGDDVAFVPASQPVAIPGAFPNSQQNALQLRGSRALQRRSDVIAASQQEQAELSDDGDGAGPSRQNKRKVLEFEGSLTPMAEEDEDSNESVQESSAKITRKKPAEGTAARAKRIRGGGVKAAGARAKQLVIASAAERTSVAKVRRSQRLSTSPRVRKA